MKTLLIITMMAVATSFSQLSLTAIGANHSIDFDGTLANVNNGVFTSSAGGVSSTPAAGQLDTDAWAFKGFSQGNVAFGGSNGSSDYRRGTSGGGVGTGGLYAFDVQNGGGVDRALGIQATGSDMTPGSIFLKMQNNTGSVITSMTVDYEIHEFNDKSNSMYVTFSHSADDVVYEDDLAADTETPTTSTGTSWAVNSLNLTLSNLNIPAGGFYYLKWKILSNTGTTSRDEIAIDDIVITPSTGACAIATEPTTSSTGIYARYQTCDGAQIYWNFGNGTDRLVVLSTAPIIGTPVDGITYNAIPYFGKTAELNAGEYIIYSGAESQINITGLTASTTYHMAVFEYNGGICGENYFTNSTVSSFTTGVCTICPQITSILIDGCNNFGTCTNEGEGEFIMMRNGDHYLPIRRNNKLVNTNILYYGTSSPASSAVTDQYSSNSSLINDLNTAAGCTVFLDALTVDVIEPNASMMFIKDTFCTDSYDFSSFCGRTIYVFMSVDRGWSIGGTFKNYSATSNIRHFRSDMSGLVLDGSCTTIDYTYDTSLLTNHTDGDYILFDGTPTTTYGGSCSPSIDALPISLIDFKVSLNGRNVNCEWKTASEINNDFFTIEKSIDGMFFKEVGSVKGAGNSVIELNYDLIDYQPYVGISYYRLKQTDFNGDFSYSTPIAVDNNLGSDKSFSITEVNSIVNPSYFVKSKYYPVSVDVFDMTGRIIESVTISSSSESFMLNSLVGSFVLRANNGYETTSHKTIK